MAASATLKRLLAELALVSVLPSAFLALYVLRFDRPVAAAWPHAIVLASVWLAVATLRLAACLGLPPAAARIACAALLGASIFVVAAYQAVVLGGLASWGHVISRDPILAYATQARELADALMLSLPLIVVSIVVALLATVVATWAWLGRFDWVPPFVGLLSRRIGATLCAGAAACVALLVFQYQFVAPEWARQGEPVSQTFSPRTGSAVMQSHRVATDDGRDPASLAEDAARAALVATEGAVRRNVIVIVVDALRPDHMGVYGYHRDTTPWLSRQAREGRLQRYDGLRSVCAESACGLLGLFASRHVHELPARPITLHHVLKANGYRVEAILGGDHRRFYGLGAMYEGIDRYIDGGDGARIAGPQVKRYFNDDGFVIDTTEALPRWDGRPTMLQFHLMSAHQLGKRKTPEAPFAPAKPYFVGDRNTTETAVNWYDNGVVQTDDVIRRLLSALESLGYLGDAVVAVTADHGEALGEHGQFAHSSGVIEPMIRIPLLLMTYGGRPARPLQRRAVASQVDIAPTLLAELDIPAPMTWSGTSLAGPGHDRPIWFQQGAEVGLIDASEPARPIKYWVHTRKGVERAYDLAKDPGEERDLLATLSHEKRKAYRLDILRRTPRALVARDGDLEF